MRLAIFLFWNVAHGPQACLSFSKDLKHVNAVVMDHDHWIYMDFGRDGFALRVLDIYDAGRFIDLMQRNKQVSAIVAVEVDKPKKISWKLYLVRTCNEIARYAAGVDVGLTFNPVHLYSKLVKYDRKRNFKILRAWRRTEQWDF